MSDDKQKVMDVGRVSVWTLSPGAAFFYMGGMAIDADGAPTAYHPNGTSGLDALGNAGRPGNWWALVTDTGTSAGTPVIQGAADPAPGFHVSTTSLQDASRLASDPRRYVDSSTIPYIVLPGSVTRQTGARLGDFAMVVNVQNSRRSAAIFADGGPADKLGEGSIALANALGVPSSPRHGGAADHIFYVVFPHSGNGKPRSQADIAAQGERLFNEWGGMHQLDSARL